MALASSRTWSSPVSYTHLDVYKRQVLGVSVANSAIGAGLRFDPPDDPEAVELQQLLRSASADEVTRKVTGLSPDHPLYADVVAVVEAHQNG